MLRNIFKRQLIEIFDTVSGNTLFYVRLLPFRYIVERHIKKHHNDLKNWDYEIVS